MKLRAAAPLRCAAPSSRPRQAGSATAPERQPDLCCALHLHVTRIETWLPPQVCPRALRIDIPRETRSSTAFGGVAQATAGWPVLRPRGCAPRSSRCRPRQPAGGNFERLPCRRSPTRRTAASGSVPRSGVRVVTEDRYRPGTASRIVDSRALASAARHAPWSAVASV